MSYGSNALIAAIGLYVLSVGDRFLLSALSGLEIVGIYSAVYNVADLLFRFAPAIFLVALRPRLFRAWDETTSPALMRLVGDAVSAVLWISGWLTIAIVWLGVSWGPLARAQELVGPISIGIAASMAAAVLSLGYFGERRVARLAANVVVAAVANIVLNVALIPSLGALGAAIATAVAFGLLLGLHVHGLRGQLNRGRVAWAGAIACLAIAIAGLARTVGGWGLAVSLVLEMVALPWNWPALRSALLSATALRRRG